MLGVLGAFSIGCSGGTQREPRNELERLILTPTEDWEDNIKVYIASRYTQRSNLIADLVNAGFKPVGRDNACELYRYHEQPSGKFKPLAFVSVELCKHDWRIETASTFL